MASSSQGKVPLHFSSRTVSLPPDAQSEGTSEPSPETVEFETGNPSAGPLVRGTLTLVDGAWDECRIVCVEGVPGIMTSADFCVFLRPQMHNVDHLRLLRPATERNKYMVAARLKPNASAKDFADALTGRPYLQGLVAETCRVRPVHGETFRESTDGEEAVFPSRQLFLSDDVLQGDGDADSTTSSSAGEADAKEDNASPASDPSETEVTCPVCLERLTGAGALVTILCNHTLHAACLAKCELNRCPVCRHAHELVPESSVCIECADDEDTWMCVVCAFVGCGIYRNKHAYEHFKETQHPFAMNLTELVFWSGERVPANSVWDYISERFVDRLAVDEGGKVVEVGGGSGAGPGAGASAAAHKGGCRAFDECRGHGKCRAPDAAPASIGFRDDVALDAAIVASRIEHAVAQERANFAAERERLVARAETAEKAAVTARRARTVAVRERKASGKRADAAEKEAAKVKEDNAFLKNLNDTLLRDQEAWQKRVQALAGVAREARTERDELKMQLRDLMMHLETQSSISASTGSPSQGNQCRNVAAAELAGGDIRIGPTAQERLAGRRRSHR